jgi:hypothetical protein
VTKYPKRHPDTAYRNVNDGGGLVVMPERSEVKVLNPVGSLVYSLLDGEHSQEQIVDSVIEAYEVPRETAVAHVRDFLRDLAANGMLLESDTPEETTA